MELVVFLKPLVDMYWQFQILDILLLALIYIITPLYLLKTGYRLRVIDFIFIVLIVLFSISFCKSYALSEYVKIISNLYMFFIGRMIYDTNRKDKFLIFSFVIVALVNIFYIITGKGFIYWGSSKTFKGVYFFKTDLALAIMQSFIFIRLLLDSNNKIIKYSCYIYLLIISPTMILFSNSRMYLLIYMIMLYLLIRENMEIKGKLQLKLTFKEMLKITLILLLSILLYSSIIQLIPWFSGNNLIGFEVNKLSDLFNESNTQGRNVIWEKILKIFSEENILSKFIGIDLVSDNVIHNGVTYESHNLFLKILFTTGYIGLSLFIISLLIFIKNINKLKDIKFKYTCIMLIVVYIISGLSYSSIKFTQQSWIFFLYMGMLITKNSSYKNIERD